ncbi:MAG: GntR family transcriptional regulator [Lachnospiraceae bacterium]|nr:GntR family transcriptional regulator [Lachnospiraceae bacterium]
MSAKYIQLASQLKNLINQKQQKNQYEKLPGAVFQLPTEAALCQMYHVSRQTVRKALSVLEEEHLIQKRQGSGSYAVPNLHQNGGNQIAVLISSNTEYIYPRLLADFCATLQKHGFSWTVYVTENQISKEREILQFLLENQETPVRGIVSEGCKTSLPTPNDDLYQHLIQKGAALLFFRGSYSNLPKIPSIKDDNYNGGYALGTYLVSLGHRKIGGIFNTDDVQSAEQRFGLLSALRDAQLLNCDENLCGFDTHQLAALRRQQDTGFLSGFLSRQLRSVTAIVCCNDEIAYWLIKEMSCKNIRVPEDVSVVCFDCSYLSDLSAVQITHYAPEEHDLGIAAAESVINLIKGGSISLQKSPWQLVRKRSSAPPAV